MNEKLQYAEMLEIPVNTCNITYKPKKRRLFSKKKKVDTEKVKEEVINKVNSLEKMSAESEGVESSLDTVDSLDTEIAVEELYDGEVTSTATVQQKPKKRGFSIVGLQVAVIVCLFAVIFLTNALNSGSGINVFLKSVFGGQVTQTVDMREYDDFNAIVPSQNIEGITLENGVMTINGEGSLYSPCSGKIFSITKTENDRFDVEIYHSENFKTVFNGLKYVYANEGDTVYSTLPIGYSEDGNVKMCFFENDGNVITDYTLNGNSVVWA